VRATRDASGRYALVYIPATRPPQLGAADRTPAAVQLDLTALSGEQLVAWWYDPRTGVPQAIGVFPKEVRASFRPPSGGPDWVLVLDDVSCAFPAPGVRSHTRPAPGAIGGGLRAGR
jgi:Putative collagen-binding domain of a collagenase